MQFINELRQFCWREPPGRVTAAAARPRSVRWLWLGQCNLSNVKIGGIRDISNSLKTSCKLETSPNSVRYFVHRLQRRHRQSKLPSFIHFVRFFQKRAATRSTAISWLIRSSRRSVSSSTERAQTESQPAGVSVWGGESQELRQQHNVYKLISLNELSPPKLPPVPM